MLWIDAMRRILLFALIALLATAGVASADRGRRWRDHHENRAWSSHRDRAYPSRREYRHRDTYRDSDRRWRSHRSYRSHPRSYRDDRVYVRDGRYRFGRGRYYTYHRPIIRHRYFDYRRRPALIIETYEPVPGYLWVRGHWWWDGYEWIWIPGHYVRDTRYVDPYYSDPYYDDPYYGY